MNINTPQVIIIVIPLYATNEKVPNMLSDLLQQKSTVHSLIDLFDEDFISYGYNVCISTVNSATDLTIHDSIPTYILSFPKGISLPQVDLNQLGALPDYMFNPANQFPIVTLLALTDDDTYRPALTDVATFYRKSYAGDDDTIKRNVICYLASPSSFKDKLSATFALDKYKCYPFSELRNLQTDPTGTQQVIPMGNAIDELKQASPDNGLSFMAIIYWILGIIGVMALIGMTYAIVSYMSTQNEIPVNLIPIEPE